MEDLSIGNFEELIGKELKNQDLGPFDLESSSDSDGKDTAVDVKSEVPCIGQYCSDSNRYEYKFSLCDRTGILSEQTIVKEGSSKKTHLIELGESKTIVNQASTSSSSNSIVEDTSRGESLKRGKQLLYDKLSKKIKFRTAGVTHEFEVDQISPLKDLADRRHLSALISARLLPQNSIHQRYTISNPHAKVNVTGMKASSCTGQQLFSTENQQCTIRNLKPVFPESKSDISISSTNSALVEFSHRFVLQANPAFKSCKLYIKQMDTTTCSKCQHLPSKCICAQCLVEVKSTILYQYKPDVKP